jgi:hypothetical protein
MTEREPQSDVVSDKAQRLVDVVLANLLNVVILQTLESDHQLTRVVLK